MFFSSWEKWATWAQDSGPLALCLLCVQAWLSPVWAFFFLVAAWWVWFGVRVVCWVVWWSWVGRFGEARGALGGCLALTGRDRWAVWAWNWREREREALKRIWEKRGRGPWAGPLSTQAATEAAIPAGITAGIAAAVASAVEVAGRQMREEMRKEREEMREEVRREREVWETRLRAEFRGGIRNRPGFVTGSEW